jgi:hypothetical protein
MPDNEEKVEKALEHLKQAEREVERDEEKLEHDQAKVEKAEEEVEHAIHQEKHENLVLIIVDGTEHKVREGKWIVRDLKAALKVDPAKVLAEITPQGLKDLDDNTEIVVHEGERFMTHARSGASS